MTVRAALVRGRRKALSLMVDTCSVTRKTGTTWDPATDRNVPTLSTVYSGPCRVKPLAAPSEIASGQVIVARHGYVVSLPWDTTAPVNRGDTVTVTASGDTWVVGRPLVVQDVDYSATTTARRLIVEDAS